MTTFVKTTVERFWDESFLAYCELIEAPNQPSDEFVGAGDYTKDIVYNPK